MRRKSVIGIDPIGVSTIAMRSDLERSSTTPARGREQLSEEDAVIQAEELSKSFDQGRVQAVDGVSVRLERGTVYGLVGPNGAGKTTLAQMLAGLVLPDSGTLTFGNIRAEPSRVVAYCPQEATLPRWFSIADLRWLHHRAALDLHVFDEALAAMTLDNHRLTLGRMSGGQRRAVTVVYAMALNRPFVVLDEPFAGLDPQNALTAVDLIRERSRQAGILVTSHQLEEIREVSDKAILMRGGRIIELLPTIDDLRTRRVLNFGTSLDNERAISLLGHSGLELVLQGERVLTSPMTSAELRRLLATAAAAELIAISVHDASHD